MRDGERVTPPQVALVPRALVEFTVRGAPQPQGRLARSKTGHLFDTNKKLEPWRDDIRRAAGEAWGGRALHEGPVGVIVDFVVARPMSAPKKRRLWPLHRPDLDRLVRAVLDSLTSTVFRDDSQVVVVSATKRYDYSEPPGARIVVRSEGDP